MNFWKANLEKSHDINNVLRQSSKVFAIEHNENLVFEHNTWHNSRASQPWKLGILGIILACVNSLLIARAVFKKLLKASERRTRTERYGKLQQQILCNVQWHTTTYVVVAQRQRSDIKLQDPSHGSRLSMASSLQVLCTADLVLSPVCIMHGW